ncbi:cardiolipin synthase [Gottfriedia acidiceleris]|uniref:Cardiolipin synthase n=1 Tax=Gottfriedia acidiceleris TaxID=371036 RepID=A0ABY4JG55_9BACI|nr:cardiolipin synthase [Gottfriedia acidiceleris]UPM52816.1 cardiolipin synthase [Gottfriedia acidiceleris]
MSQSQGLYQTMHWIIIISVIGISCILFLGNRNPQSTISWLLILSLAPTFGVILYVLFGRLKKRRKKLINHSMFKTPQILSVKNDIKCNSLSKKSQKLSTIIEKFTGVSINRNSSASLLINGDEMFSKLKEALLDAKNYIYIQYYIFRADTIGSELLDILRMKVNEGVVVRLLVDGLGSKSLKKKLLKNLSSAGVKVSIFDPITTWSIGTINYRNHRKIVVVDGIKGFTGGLNVGDEYLGRSKIGFWRDTHLYIEGSAVEELQNLFLQDWHYSTSDNSSEKIQVNRLSSHEKSIGQYHQDEKNKVSGAIQIFGSGPDTKEPTMRNAFHTLLSIAENNIWIATPYFVPDQEIFTILKLKVMSGLDVRIIYPGKSDSILSDSASKSYFSPLLESGVKIYTYKNNFLHSKVMLIDNEIASVGTANLDVRSLHLNYELTSFLYESHAVDQVKQSFLNDFSISTQLDSKEFIERSLFKKLIESLSRLLSPLL